MGNSKSTAVKPPSPPPVRKPPSPPPVRKPPSPPPVRKPPSPPITHYFTTLPRSSSSSPASEPVPEIGRQLIKHTANNYVIPKANKECHEKETCINVPYKKYAAKFLIRVCPHYNSRYGCLAPVCRRFHVCNAWIQGKCTKDPCECDHSIVSSHNISMVNVFSSQRDYSSNMIIDILKNNQKPRRSKRNEHIAICMFNIMKKCHKSPCIFAHVNKSYTWEIKVNDIWVPLCYSQSDKLETLYCQPMQEIVYAPPLPKYVHAKPVRNLKFIFDKRTNWKVNFSTMKFYSDNPEFTEYDMRRLSTPSDIGNYNRLATRWIWYWQDDCGLWNPYTDGCYDKFFIYALSDHLEHTYMFSENSEVEVTVGNYPYVINFSSMTQTNKSTGRTRNICRRPVSFENKEEEVHFDHFFTKKAGNLRQPVVNMGTEFIFIRELMARSLHAVSLISVERIINDHLWKAYLNKKALLESLYTSNIAAVNEQYLFHGTKYSVIDQICQDNFDWRLFGTNVGNIYGHGVYFSNCASLSNSYSETDNSGVKVMFIVLVLVGSMTIGNRNMKFPPKNPATGRVFDTTCDDKVDSKIFVKYNRDEYYPAYIAFYKCVDI